MSRVDKVIWFLIGIGIGMASTTILYCVIMQPQVFHCTTNDPVSGVYLVHCR